MLIKDSFKKNIFRDIDPVVKADNDDHLANELDEFVVTNEIKQRLYAFFDEYNDPGSSCNGAWISGFFGSGKSHLLKIMAVMMENRNVMGIGAMDRLLPMFDDEPSLKGAIQHSAELHPSESVLFNIDSYAPNQGQAETGALLEAFIKAFNHHCGYFDGGQLHIAAMERELDKNGHYQDFRSAIERICGKPWEVVRKSALINEVKISQAFDEALDNPAGTTTRVIRYYSENYKPDIRGFATTVNEYIESKGKGFRLNFFVDEVGQFIANNTQLMVNLQSVVEELNIQCGGNSWVIVTSQEDINSVIGETSKENANDFSKIQGRFGVKMPLSSSEAGEVIRDRLLAKKPETRDEFDALYYKYKDDFGVLFDFTGGDRKYRNYKDSDDFFRTYPFVPYQFDVFSSALRSLSDKNVFQGKHNSTGARSMLGVFQDVAERICAHDASTEEGTLAPFDMMFEGLRTSMRTEIYAAVSEAERNLSDETAIRVLKALLLVKYCDEINATAANLRVLLYGAFTENAEELQRKVQDALNLLESQVYIRRNGDSYEYLTNEEKDVENDIHSIVVSESDSRKEIANILHDIIGMYKVTYKNGAFSQSYSYDLAIDGDFQAQKKNDLSVNVVTTPQTTGLVDVPHTAPRTLTVFLSGADAFLGELRIFLQTESYARQNSGASDMKAAIITDKRTANRERRKRLQAMFGELLENASYYASSTEVTQDLTGDGKAQLSQAVLELVKRTYTGLQQISNTYTDQRIKSQVLDNQLYQDLPEYCATVLSRIGQSAYLGNVTVGGDGSGSLVEYFSKNEYGWPEWAVRSAIARLYAAGKVEVRRGGSPLEGADLANALGQKRDLDKLTVRKVEEVTADQLEQLKKDFHDVTGTSPVSGDAKSIAKELCDYASDQLDNLSSSSHSASILPFGDHFRSCYTDLMNLKKNLDNDWRWSITTLPSEASKLKDEIADLSRMSQFASGSPMYKRWEHVKHFLEARASDANDLGIGADVITQARALIQNPDCYKDGSVPKVAKQVDALERTLGQEIEKLRSEAKNGIDGLRAQYENSYDLTKLSADKKAEFDSIFDNGIKELETKSSPYAIRSFPKTFQDRETGRILNIVNPPKPPVSEPGRVNPPVSNPPVQHNTVNVASLGRRGFSAPVIQNMDDADAYLAALRSAIQSALDNGDIVIP